MAVSDKEWITDEDLPYEFHVAQLDTDGPSTENLLDRAVSTFERNFIIRALEKNGWNVTGDGADARHSAQHAQVQDGQARNPRARPQDPRQLDRPAAQRSRPRQQLWPGRPRNWPLADRARFTARLRRTRARPTPAASRWPICVADVAMRACCRRSPRFLRKFRSYPRFACKRGRGYSALLIASERTTAASAHRRGRRQLTELIGRARAPPAEELTCSRRCSTCRCRSPSATKCS